MRNRVVDDLTVADLSRIKSNLETLGAMISFQFSTDERLISDSVSLINKILAESDSTHKT